MTTPGTPTISVFIPAYGHARFIRQTLESVLGQTRPPAQVIVINDGSPDDTRSAVRPFLDRITYLEQENRGIVPTVNRALDLVTSDYISPGASDDWLERDAFETLGAVLDREPTVGLAYGGVSFADADGRVLDRPRWVRFPVGRHRGIERLIREGYIAGAGVLVRRAAIRNAGRHMLDFESNHDWAMWLSVALSGWDLYGIPNRVAFYRRHGGNITSHQRRSDSYGDQLRISAILRERYAQVLTAGQLRAFRALERQARRKIALQRLVDGNRGEARRALSDLLVKEGDSRAVLGLALSMIPPRLLSWLVAYDSSLMKRHARMLIWLKQWL